ncbi:MAG: hypothetical protein HYX96_03985 [Chloroflexi bacterium]|nr:hypothetical protein [Chloroflexota bacterium]
MEEMPGGYMGQMLRVDLSAGTARRETLPAEVARKFVGGTGFGLKYLYDEVGPGVSWSSPENRLMLFSGPLGGTSAFGSGTICAVTRGAMTGFAGTSQANGFFGAYLKFAGLDGIILQGAALKWSYLFIHDGAAELRDAAHLVGKDCWETEDALKKELGKSCSVYMIGPAGENLVRYAVIVGDRTHVMSKNGMGAVMGSKKLKAIVIARERQAVPVRDAARLKAVLTQARTSLSTYQGAHPLSWRHLNEGGTAWHFAILDKLGFLPVKNCTTNIFPEAEQFKGENIRATFETKPTPCWACPLTHVRTIKINHGRHKGYSGGEPEYEEFASLGPQIGVNDPAESIVLANYVDRLGLDCNEVGWVLGWVMECYEAGALKKSDLDGLEMNWGDVEATRALLDKITRRQGIGDILAEGAKRAEARIGGQTSGRAVWAGPGNTIRGFDCRSSWPHLIDQTFANTGTSEVGAGSYPVAQEFGLPPVKNAYAQFDPEEVSTNHARLSGIRQWQDCLGICNIVHMSCFQVTVDCLSAVTGWDYTQDEARQTGRRIVNMLRLFNLRSGMTPEMEVASPRYASDPVDGPVHGKVIHPHLGFMRENYYKHMGWDPVSGKPLPDTLAALGLSELIPDLDKI